MKTAWVRALTASAVLAVSLLLSGCGGGCSSCDDGGTPAPNPAQLKPDFMLADVNPNSGTHNATVSPRQHLTRVSAWYFGHAT
ncbi:MAG: hypothetical protein QNJ98_14450 [Planctomycetota bacterium]|nr:hypothetical protein [Planctomycetota bacterium]